MCAALCLLATGGVLAEERRDPFEFGYQPSAAAESHSLVLVGVLWTRQKPVAIVGDETVMVGDEVGGWRVVDIRDDGIAIQRGGRLEFVKTGRPIP